MNCPTCGYPMAWSIDHERLWCSVFGTHAQRPRGEFSDLVRLCMETPDTSRRGAHNRARRGRSASSANSPHGYLRAVS